MDNGHNPKLRFGMSLEQARQSSGQPGIGDAPALPVINYALVGKEAPRLLSAQAGTLPRASTVVITWADAEWAALQHVFCAGGATMPYSDRSRGAWPDWQKYSNNMPSGVDPSWTFWGEYRLVEVSGNAVLLFKSNTHLDWPGATYLMDLVKLMIAQVQPTLILSIGTAGGAKTGDHIGTVRAVNAGTLFESDEPQANWPVYECGWKANDATLANPNFKQLVFPVPSKTSDLETLASRFNQQYGTNYTLEQLDPDGLNLGDATPQIGDQTGGDASLLTTSTFVVGTTAGTYQSFTSIEMDDAVIGEACKGTTTQFGFVRNVSDPVQNAALPAKAQGNWGSVVYDAYGFYTSYNGALAAWAMLA